MTKEEFLAELGSTREQFDWILDPHTPPHQDRRSTPRYNLRALVKGSPEAVFDPLAALCYVRTGRVYEAQSWPDAARALHMDSSDAAMVLAATSDRTWESVDGKRRPVPELVELRDLLVRATGAAVSGGGARKGRKAENTVPDPPPKSRPAVGKGRRSGGTSDTKGAPVATAPVHSRFQESGVLRTMVLVARSMLVGMAVVLATTILYALGVLYIVGLSTWAADQYGGSVAFDFASLLGRPSILWLGGLLIFAATFHRECTRTFEGA